MYQLSNPELLNINGGATIKGSLIGVPYQLINGIFKIVKCIFK